ncbi:iron chelate uptake ABC transporter family permease subunit [Bacillus mangrovi]|uniref:Iron chelate uptake ABC transporter family permease subunit n=1 Tax=Metabacillus mangrovi TaxID=1491830 RepID=A0A7X2S2E0_9BACI|nr:metal ABC transporter permease [Metabacillus mangrovi]MTH52442.1 iron chelate uptake ABC transporter family permease subunit [Metabacillus mangrovi]
MISPFFEYEFLQNALFSGLLIGLIAPLLGVYIVVRRLSLIADALSHVTLAGIAASLFLEKKMGIFAGVNPLYMGMAFSVTGSLMIERLRSLYKHYQELAIPIILSGGIGIGAIFISLADGFNKDLLDYLFGSVSVVTRSDFYLVAGISAFVILVVTVLYKELFVLSFDEEHAKASGIRAKWIHLIFILTVALVIAASMRIVGILLVSSLMTLPVAASIKLARGFKQAILLAVIFGELSVMIGLILAYHLDLAPGGTIVVLNILTLALAILAGRFKRGYVQ